MAFNVGLAQRVLEQVEEHPENHNQAFFQSPFCGTQHCIAGWAIALEEPDYDWNTNYHRSEYGDFEDNPNNPEAVALSLLVTGPKSVRNARLEHRLRKLFYVHGDAEAIQELKNLIEENS